MKNQIKPNLILAQYITFLLLHSLSILNFKLEKNTVKTALLLVFPYATEEKSTFLVQSAHLAVSVQADDSWRIFRFIILDEN